MGAPGDFVHLTEKLDILGFAVDAPILERCADGERPDIHQWLSAARSAYIDLRERCDRVVVAGHSTGGALALILAEQYPVDALVCLAPALRTRLRGDAAAYRSFGMRRLMRLASVNMFAVVAPALVIQPIHDNTLNPSGAKNLYDGIGSTDKELIWLEKSGHALMNGPERDFVAEEALHWIVNKPKGKLLAK